MIDIENGLALLPTRGRVHTLLPEFFECGVAKGMSMRGVVLVSTVDYLANQEAYDALKLPDNWLIHICKNDTCAENSEEGWREFGQDKDYVFWLSDDSRPETEEFDQKLVSSLTGWNFVSCEDGIGLPNKVGTAMVFSGDLLRSVGHMFVPGSAHNFVDDMWCHLAELTGCWTQRKDVLVRHAHSQATGKVDNTTVLSRSHWERDERAFQRWIDEDRTAAAERVLALMEGYGVRLLKHDLTGISVMIATPCADGKYESVYVSSLMSTKAAIEQFGGRVQWLEQKYNSDVSSARNILFSAFLRSEATHMLFVDDDMAWTYDAAIKLLMAKKDLCAIAGPRKVEPPSFAVNVSDDYGNPLPLRVDVESGMFEVSGVGTGFMLISRACAEKMASSYPETAYDDVAGRQIFGLFDPFIVNRRRLADDFGYCHRWRAIGGTVYVAGEIPLGHVGGKIWHGSWLANLQERMAQEQAA